MAQVEVWIENRKWIHGWMFDENGELVVCSFPPQKNLIGRCEAAPKAVAGLVGIDKAVAAEALSKIGRPVFIGDKVMPKRLPELYLVIYPYQGRGRRKK